MRTHHILMSTALALMAAFISPSETKHLAWSAEPSPERNTSVRYECRKDGSKFVTIAHNDRGPIDLVKWKSTFFGSQWTPERRCTVVTQRFQKFSDAKILRFISYDRLNNYNVLCIVETASSQACMKDSLLLTLEHRDDPAQVLSSLFNTNFPLLRGSKPVVDIEQILQTRPLRPDVPSLVPVPNNRER